MKNFIVSIIEYIPEETLQKIFKSEHNVMVFAQWLIK